MSLLRPTTTINQFAFPATKAARGACTASKQCDAKQFLSNSLQIDTGRVIPSLLFVRITHFCYIKGQITLSLFLKEQNALFALFVKINESDSLFLKEPVQKIALVALLTVTHAAPNPVLLYAAISNFLVLRVRAE